MSLPHPLLPTSSDKTIDQFFDDVFEERLNRFPQLMTTLGIKRDQDKLDDLSDRKLVEDRDLVEDQLLRLKSMDYADLSPANQLNYRLFQNDAELKLRQFPYRFHEYLATQKFGLHTDLPAFMINMHRITSMQDANDYIARLYAVGKTGPQVLQGLESRAILGMLPPAFLVPQIIDDCRRFIGADDDAAPDSNAIYEDFRSKITSLSEIDATDKNRLLEEAKRALRQAVLPFYRELQAYMEKQAHNAPAEGSAGAMPDGENYYRLCLERHTSTALTADEIFRLGCDEVEKLQSEIIALQPRLGRSGSLRDLFHFAREHQDFYHPQSEQGRQACLDDLNRYVRLISPLLPQLFGTLPEDALLIKAVERHREHTAGLAFYEGPSADGQRPGIFYVNLCDLRQLPIFSIEALAYHEALPGHHLQFSIANRLHSLPRFRRYIDYTAYVEGWGLYSERLAKEIGFYRDPWSDFGRLTMELKRACRLVVDTGIHAKGWTRQQAINYLHDNTPSSLGQVVKEIDRYIVMPGQATSYKVGMGEILKLRGLAQSALGGSFRLGAFHDELLRHGPLPLGLLREQIEAWMKKSQ